MGQGSKFNSALSTRGGRANFITDEEIKSGDKFAKEILNEMEDEGINFSKEKIVFAARLENNNKIFLETNALNHIILQHDTQFKKTFGINKNGIKTLLCDTISKGKLVTSFRHDSNGVEGYRSIYYYKGKYCVVYGIASNGYIVTAFPISCGEVN